ncbi:cell division protein FtsZ [Segatella bryantii]|uniref:Cell division protein FtsZ n=1 Tax=Segatella bryantii TaxID=77095 RepID=A0ABX4EFD3_SEGBR|nr:cell division protein FtsZ [Segatella bryantii]OYP53750.1 cell division protein FtsZ [Segatella bryantii]UKK82020.1 cell division protein FtsZ [Segatella bryantii]
MLDFDVEIEDKTKDIIKVIGVGGGGCNAVSNMYREGIDNVSFAVCNTDSQSLRNSPVPVKIQLGTGLGAGANPEIAKRDAEEAVDDIKRLLSDGTKMCFITAGMGGGTGTGASPIIAGVCKQLNILTVGIVTIPFFFEKRNKIITALQGVEQLRKNVDALLIVNNERLCDIYADTRVPIKEAFKTADKLLSDATRSIAELITVEGTINLDFRDVEATIKGGGGALMAIGRASGEKRVQNAILNALDSPLLYGSDISKAKRILFNIYTSEEHPLLISEMQEIDSFMYELDPNINVIWGVSDDNTVGEDAKVIILATGLDNEFLPREKDHGEDETLYYNEIIESLYRKNQTEHSEDADNTEKDISTEIAEEDVNAEDADNTEKDASTEIAEEDENDDFSNLEIETLEEQKDKNEQETLENLEEKDDQKEDKLTFRPYNPAANHNSVIKKPTNYDENGAHEYDIKEQSTHRLSFAERVRLRIKNTMDKFTDE